MLIDGTEFKAMNATILRARGRGPGARLLEAVLVLAGAEAELVSHGERPWASATFSGARHTIALTFHGTDGVAAAEHFIEALPDHEFAIPGQLVADAAIREVKLDMLHAPRFEVEAELLLLEEG